MTAVRYATILLFSLIALSIQTAHATKGSQPKMRWMSMDLSHTLTAPLPVDTSARETSLLQQLSVQESALKATHNSRYITALLLDNNSRSIHGKSMDNDSQQQQAWLTIKHDDELISHISVPATDTLLGQSQQLLAILDAQQATMGQAVQDATFDANDALITIIMPGGLLYASHKKLSHIQAKEQLAQTVSTRDELAMDIMMLRSIANPVALAIID